MCISLVVVLSTLTAGAESEGQCSLPRADLGIRFQFTAGDFLVAEDGSRWIRFLTEPRVTEVTRGGPADGRLEAGDSIVAVDGNLVTTESGSHGLQFLPEKEKEIVVRRRGEVREVRVRPRSLCEGSESTPVPADDLERSSVPRPQLGIGFRCTDCGLDRVEGRARWRFGRVPEVTSVVPGSAAGAAGIQAGDLLVAIDGHDATSSEGGRRFSEIEQGEVIRLIFERAGVRREVTLVVRGGK
jgi:regulator of sigma E protease